MHIKITLRALKLFMFFALFLTLSSDSFSGVNFNGVLNVRDFGAKGDGVADDTESLRSVFAEASKYRMAYAIGVYGSSKPEIYFPAGRYMISETLNIGYYISVRGVPGAVIIQSNKDEDIFNFNGYRARFDGLAFEGGRRALVYDLTNLDSTNTAVYNCTFRGQSGYSIDIEGISSILHIKNAEFDNSMGVLRTNNDVAVLEDSIIKTNPDMSGPAIIAWKMLIMENVEGYAYASEECDEQVWIDYRGHDLLLRNVTLKSASGPGMLPIKSYPKYRSAYRGVHSSIIVEDSAFDVSSSRDKILMHLAEIPNLISVSNTVDISGKPADIFGFAKLPDEDYFNISEYGLAYTFSNNGTLNANLPASMKNYIREPHAGKVEEFMRSMLIVSKDEFLSEDSFATVQSLNVLDFGARSSYSFDNTEALRSVFEKASVNPGTEVVFPSGYYRITDTIIIPGDVVLRGVAKAVIAMEGKEKDIFKAESARNISVTGLNFIYGRSSLVFEVEPEYAGRFFIHYSIFQSNSGPAVRAVSGDFNVSVDPAARLRISNVIFMNNHQVLLSNLDLLQDTTWIHSKPWQEGMEEQFPAVFENKGILRIQNLCGVPLRGKNARWVDNYGDFFADFGRFGGEFAGFPQVFTYVEEGHTGRTLLQNGWLYSHAGLAPVVVKQVPALIALRNNVGVEDVNLQPTYIIVQDVADNQLDSVIYDSGNTRPPTIKSVEISSTR